jgi:hypothetical protein
MILAANEADILVTLQCPHGINNHTLFEYWGAGKKGLPSIFGCILALNDFKEK